MKQLTISFSLDLLEFSFTKRPQKFPAFLAMKVKVLIKLFVLHFHSTCCGRKMWQLLINDLNPSYLLPDSCNNITAIFLKVYRIHTNSLYMPTLDILFEINLQKWVFRGRNTPGGPGLKHILIGQHLSINKPYLESQCFSPPNYTKNVTTNNFIHVALDETPCLPHKVAFQIVFGSITGAIIQYLF